ncbi:uncharacterized protein LOC131682911 [Topomyia yanbarensis]|uniref:uncharacterized protein LOC131682911 n=1 Tax=Topomyia yanbarensis TaxID=2498891 RepID=UPI00273A7FBB|nr:uncharacterized protein LOC131682911 [Topomyia yanbarensis]
MANQATEEFLRQNHLIHLINPFKDANITLDDFEYLRQNTAELQQFVPILRDRIDFVNSLKKRVSDKETQVNLDRPFDPRETLQICKRYDSGKMFLAMYVQKDGTKLFQPACRKFIKVTVVEHFYRSGKGHISHQNFVEMLNLIKQELPEEHDQIWYSAASMGTASGGLLYSRCRYLQQHDLRYRKEKKRLISHSTTVAEQFTKAWDTLSNEDQNHCLSAKLRLKDIGYNNTAEIVSAWKTSFPLRRYEAVSGKLKFLDWDVLDHFGETLDLVSYDFATIHADNHNSIHAKIPQFIGKFKDVYTSHKVLVDEDKLLTAAILSTFVDGFEISEKCIFIAFLTPPLILRPNFIIKGKERS